MADPLCGIKIRAISICIYEKNIFYMNKIILTVIFSLMYSFVAFTQESINFQNLSEINFEATKQIAKEKNKPILLYFTSNVCGLCIKMEKNVFPNNEVCDFFNRNFICVKSKKIFKNISNSAFIEQQDEYKQMNKLLNRYDKEFDVKANPTFIVIDADGNIIYRIQGYKNTSEFLEFGKNALNEDKSPTVLKKKINEGHYTFENVKDYLFCLVPVRCYMDEGFKCEAQDVLDNYFGTQNEIDYTSENNWYLINKYVENPKSKPFDYLLNNQDEFILKYGDKEVNKKILHILDFYTSGNRKSKRYKEAKKYIETLDYPQAKALVKHISLEEEKDLNNYAIKINNVFSHYFYYFEPQIFFKSSEILNESTKENTTINLKTLNIVSDWTDLIVDLHPNNKNYRDFNIKIKERMSSFNK